MIGHRLLFALIIGLAIQAPLMSIVINNTNTLGYVTGDTDYTGVVEVVFSQASQPGSTFICSGALVSPTQILTAGHCISGAEGWSVTFQTASGTRSIGVSDSALDPMFGPLGNTGLDVYDVGLLTLSTPAPLGAQIYELDLTPSGFVFGSSTVDMAGYGLGGNPKVGFLGGGTRRHAQNTLTGVIVSVNGVYTPDYPLYAPLTFGTGTADGTGLPNAGDSGGPLFFDGQILGVSSFGNLPRSDMPSTGPYEYGVQYYAAFADIANPLIGGWVESELVPEPGTWALVALGGLALCARLTRRTGHRPS